MPTQTHVSDHLQANLAILMHNVQTARPQDRDRAFAAVRAMLMGSTQGLSPR